MTYKRMFPSFPRSSLAPDRFEMVMVSSYTLYSFIKLTLCSHVFSNTNHCIALVNKGNMIGKLTTKRIIEKRKHDWKIIQPTCEGLEAVHPKVVSLKNLNTRAPGLRAQLAGQGIQRVEHGRLPKGRVRGWGHECRTTLVDEWHCCALSGQCHFYITFYMCICL